MRSNSRKTKFDWKRWSGVTDPKTTHDSDIADTPDPEHADQPSEVPVTSAGVVSSSHVQALEPEQDPMSTELSRLVNPGWSAEHWLERLEYLAELSKSLNPDVSAQRQREADAVRKAVSEGEGA